MKDTWRSLVKHDRVPLLVADALDALDDLIPLALCGTLPEETKTSRELIRDVLIDWLNEGIAAEIVSPDESAVWLGWMLVYRKGK
jgi:hypothetical protein